MKLSIHMMILNGAGVIERALRPFARLDAEAVVVDTGSSDGTPEFVQHLCSEKFPGDYGRESRLRCKIAARLSPGSHPGLYFEDSPSSWRTPMPGPFTGIPILRDWAAARNVGLDSCSGEYILKLDADDELVEGAENIPSTLRHMDANPGLDFLMCPYEIMESPELIETIVMYDRLWRNKPNIRFTQVIHEYLLGKGKTSTNQPNWSMAARGLRFRDWRDSPGAGVRIAHRNYKVFMREYERMEDAGIEPSPAFLLSTIGEVTDADPVLALRLLHMAGERDPGLRWRSSYHLDLGRAYAKDGQGERALLSFEESVRLDPNSASAHLALGFQMFGAGSSCRWERIDRLTMGLAKVHVTSGFNVDRRELRRATSLLKEYRQLI